jgi:quinol monooxygenase YgiN
MADVLAIVVYQADSDSIEDAAEAFRRVVERTHEEDGALTCAIARDPADPTIFILIERWASQEAVDEHLAQPYVAEFVARVPGLFATEPQVYFLEDMPMGDPVKGVM